MSREPTAFERIADAARIDVARHTLDAVKTMPTAELQDAMLAGSMCGVAQVAWLLRGKRSYDEVMEHWRMAGETYFKQFLAEDTMGEPQGGKQ